MRTVEIDTYSVHCSVCFTPAPIGLSIYEAAVHARIDGYVTDKYGKWTCRACNGHAHLKSREVELVI